MTSTPSAPLVCVIVLNLNGRQHLEYSLPSICATDYANLRILVVDNDSSDDSRQLVLNFPVELLVSPVNLGWSGGNNLGIRRAMEVGASYVVLANNDIKVHSRWVAEAVRLAEAEPGIAVVGFDVHEPNPGDSDRDAGFTRACEEWRQPRLGRPTFVGGMAMFVRIRAFEELGLIDENFFVYGEENDFQIRARRAGYHVASVDVPVWHFGQGFFGTTSMRASLLQTQNNIQLLIKHESMRQLLKSAVSHVWRRCVGHGHDRASSSVERRLQGTSKSYALLVLLLAAGRIALQAPAILRRRAEDGRRIEAARTKHLMDRVTSGFPTA